MGYDVAGDDVASQWDESNTISEGSCRDLCSGVAGVNSYVLVQNDSGRGCYCKAPCIKSCKLGPNEPALKMVEQPNHTVQSGRVLYTGAGRSFNICNALARCFSLIADRKSQFQDNY